MSGTRADAPRPSWGLVPGDELQPGRTVVRPLGDSLHHEVLLVLDRPTGATGAAKVARPTTERRERQRSRLEHEASMLARLDHPAFTRLLDVALDAERPHLLVEVAEGPTLRQVVRREGHVPLGQALPLLRQVASGLSHLAERGIVHRDLTPSNVVVGASPFIIDLARARDVQALAVARDPRPGNAFRAPEHAEPGLARGPIGPAADVFSFGATMFYALTGHAPFRAGSRRLEPFRRPLPRALRALLAQMLEQDQTRRPSMAEVEERLAHADAGRSARRPGRMHLPLRGAPRPADAGSSG